MDIPEIKREDLVKIRDAITGGEEVSIRIRRPEEFIITAKAVSEFLHDLPLTHEQNDRMIELMLEHVHAAESSGFHDGVRYGIVIGQHWDEP